ncbi:hypothetical protein [Methylocapsa sp. S129]|uniref:hypothetical protein n=1 Tax=Methylocapsa sp. S129 TaxID=1641869 RepID=UPI00131CF1A5|nr:hypothetical protein [Methylocapsa sp. S129]
MAAIAALHSLIDWLNQRFRKGAGARLTPQSVALVIGALRAYVKLLAPTINGRVRPFQVEAIDSRGWTEEVLALAANENVARAAFNEACHQQPGRKIRMTYGARVVAVSPPDSSLASAAGAGPEPEEPPIESGVEEDSDDFPERC